MPRLSLAERRAALQQLRQNGTTTTRSTTKAALGSSTRKNSESREGGSTSNQSSTTRRRTRNNIQSLDPNKEDVTHRATVNKSQPQPPQHEIISPPLRKKKDIGHRGNDFHFDYNHDDSILQPNETKSTATKTVHRQQEHEPRHSSLISNEDSNKDYSNRNDMNEYGSHYSKRFEEEALGPISKSSCSSSGVPCTASPTIQIKAQPKPHIITPEKENTDDGASLSKRCLSTSSSSFDSGVGGHASFDQSSGLGGTTNDRRITTERRIAQIHDALGVPFEAVIRPTEAQLRWAHFHRLKTATETQKKIHRLYQYPSKVEHVPGAFPEDGDTTSYCSSSSDSENDNNEGYASSDIVGSDVAAKSDVVPTSDVVEDERVMCLKLNTVFFKTKTKRSIHHTEVGARSTKTQALEGVAEEDDALLHDEDDQNDDDGELPVQAAIHGDMVQLLQASPMVHSPGTSSPPHQHGRRRRKHRKHGKNSKHHQRQQNKVQVSRGRRALLRVSMRDYEWRKQQQEQLQGQTAQQTRATSTPHESDMASSSFDYHERYSSEDDTTNEHLSQGSSSNSPNRQMRGPTMIQACPAPPLRTIYGRGRRRSRRGGGKKHCQEDAERRRRFEDAYNATLSFLADQQQASNSGAVSVMMSYYGADGDDSATFHSGSTSATKRWTRGHVESDTSVDYSQNKFGSLPLREEAIILGGLPKSIHLERKKKQKHAKGINLEETESWIRYMQQQQERSEQQRQRPSAEDDNQGEFYEIDELADEARSGIKRSASHHEGEEAFKSLLSRLEQSTQNQQQGEGEAMKNSTTHMDFVPEAYKDALTSRQLASFRKQQSKKHISQKKQLPNDDESKQDEIKGILEANSCASKDGQKHRSESSLSDGKSDDGRNDRPAATGTTLTTTPTRRHKGSKIQQLTNALMEKSSPDRQNIRRTVEPPTVISRLNPRQFEQGGMSNTSVVGGGDIDGDEMTVAASTAQHERKTLLDATSDIAASIVEDFAPEFLLKWRAAHKEQSEENDDGKKEPNNDEGKKDSSSGGGSFLTGSFEHLKSKVALATFGGIGGAKANMDLNSNATNASSKNKSEAKFVETNDSTIESATTRPNLKLERSWQSEENNDFDKTFTSTHDISENAEHGTSNHQYNDAEKRLHAVNDKEGSLKLTNTSTAQNISALNPTAAKKQQGSRKISSTMHVGVIAEEDEEEDDYCTNDHTDMPLVSRTSRRAKNKGFDTCFLSDNGESNHTALTEETESDEGYHSKSKQGAGGCNDQATDSYVTSTTTTHKNDGHVQTDHEQLTHASSSDQKSFSLTSDMIKKWMELNGQVVDEKLNNEDGAGDDDDDKSSMMMASDVGEEEYRQRKLQPHHVPGLMLTPQVLTRRHQQAIHILEQQEWTKAAHLITANPWLVEMTDVVTGQLLLHTLSLYGTTAPHELNERLIRAFPSSVHKFDVEGNLPLHLAALSGNMSMILMLADEFSSGASVQNERGMLPLHMAVLSGNVDAVQELCTLFPQGTAVADQEGNMPLHLAAATLQGEGGKEVVQMLLEFDIPVKLTQRHVVPVLGISDETDLCSIMMGADDTLEDSAMKDASVEVDRRGRVVAKADHDDASATSICLYRNNVTEYNPLIMAVISMAGWQVVETLLKGSTDGCREAALEVDANGNGAIHYASRGKYADAAVVLTLLKYAPKDVVRLVDASGVLPIELMCLQSLPREVLLATVLNDLPFDRASDPNPDCSSMRSGASSQYQALDHRGQSWWFLTCECNDEHDSLVRDVLRMCTYPQRRALCFMSCPSSLSISSSSTRSKRNSRSPSSTNKTVTVLSKATPSCKEELRRALRFLDRYEFLSLHNDGNDEDSNYDSGEFEGGATGSGPIYVDESRGIRVYEMLDFGPSTSATDKEDLQRSATTEHDDDDGRLVTLTNYNHESIFLEDISPYQSKQINLMFVEKVSWFQLEDGPSFSLQSTNEIFSSSSGDVSQFFVATELPELTLADVVETLPTSDGEDWNWRKVQPERHLKYLQKICAVLRIVAKALRHLHTLDRVHARLSLETVGKYAPDRSSGDNDNTKSSASSSQWKLSSVLGSPAFGQPVAIYRMGEHSPPESVRISQLNTKSPSRATFVSNLKAHPSIDIWAFGKLMFEALTGETLFAPGVDLSNRNDDDVLVHTLGEWSERHTKRVIDRLLELGIATSSEHSCIDLISKCLSLDEKQRFPFNGMDEVLAHPFWKHMKQRTSSSSSGKHVTHQQQTSNDAPTPRRRHPPSPQEKEKEQAVTKTGRQGWSSASLLSSSTNPSASGREKERLVSILKEQGERGRHGHGERRNVTSPRFEC